MELMFSPVMLTLGILSQGRMDRIEYRHDEWSRGVDVSKEAHVDGKQHLS